MLRFTTLHGTLTGDFNPMSSRPCRAYTNKSSGRKGRAADYPVGLSNMNKRWQQFIKRFHPEGIPWPGSALYNVISSTAIFKRHYELVAHDITHYGTTSRVLDIGTGPGQLLIAMQKVIPDARLDGIDISPAMVALAKRKLKKLSLNHQIEVRIANANALPYTDGTFDIVVSTGSLHHWKSPICALSEVYRVLKHNGYALMYDLVREMPKEICEDLRARFGNFHFALLWLHSFEEPFLNPEEMDELGRRTDFSVEGTNFTGALCCLVLKKVAI